MAEGWFASIRRAGKFVALDLDDDIVSENETRRRVDLQWMEGKTVAQLEAERFERIWVAQTVDAITVSTQRLATIVRQYTDRPVHVVGNAIDLQWFRAVLRATPRTVPGLTVGWAGGKRSDADVREMAMAWQKVAARYPSSVVNFVVAGYLPPIIKELIPEDRLTVLGWRPLETYPASYRQIDIGCCSVAPTMFNAAKTAIKSYEHSAAGAAVVASPLLYSKVIDHGTSGYIAQTVEEWDEALSRLIESPSLRSMMARRLLKVVEKKHSLAGNLWRWPAAWQQIAEEARSQGGVLKLA
jgi:glycosyltransferase involved in cell wall biosynthesis